MKSEPDVRAAYERRVREWAGHLEAGCGPFVLTSDLAKVMQLAWVLEIPYTHVPGHLEGVRRELAGASA